MRTTWVSGSSSSGADRIIHCIPDTGLSHSERLAVAVRRDELLTKLRLVLRGQSILLNGSSEWACARYKRSASREGLGVELEDKPPVDGRLSSLDKRRWRNLRPTKSGLSRQQAERKTNYCNV